MIWDNPSKFLIWWAAHVAVVAAAVGFDLAVATGVLTLIASEG